MLNKSESKYFKTAARMDEALLELLEKKDLAYITVKEICEKAGVNRSTFYLHYETMADLLSETIQYLHSLFLDYFAPNAADIVVKLRNCPFDELNLITPEYLTPYLAYIKDHKRLFRTAIENADTLRLGDTYDKMFLHVFTPILERYQVPERDRNYIMAFFIHGLLAIVIEWLKGNCTDSIDDIISLILRCVWKQKEWNVEG